MGGQKGANGTRDGGSGTTRSTHDTGASMFFDHRDPAMVSWLNSRIDKA